MNCNVCFFKSRVLLINTEDNKVLKLRHERGHWPAGESINLFRGREGRGFKKCNSLPIFE